MVHLSQCFSLNCSSIRLVKRFYDPRSLAFVSFTLQCRSPQPTFHPISWDFLSFTFCQLKFFSFFKMRNEPIMMLNWYSLGKQIIAFYTHTARIVCKTYIVLICIIVSYLDKGSANFFCKEPNSNYFRLCRLCLISVAYFTSFILF